MRSFFITGTDTGVGKTALTAILLAAARATGSDTVAMKPVQTGVRRTDAPAGDLHLAACAAGWSPARAEAGILCPYRFEPACSPHLASALAGLPIQFSRIRNALKTLRTRHDAVLVEGAGGVQVPIAGRRTMLDLMVMMELPVLVAARPGLGTLNHTLLTCEAIRGRGLELGGVVIVQAEPGRWTALMEDNRLTLLRLGVPVLGRLPYMPGFARSPRPACLRALANPATRWIASLLHA